MKKYMYIALALLTASTAYAIKAPTTLTDTTLSGGTLSGAITATAATITGGTHTGVTISSPVLSGAMTATGATISSPTISGPTLTGAVNGAAATITSTLTGNASTATALAANPSDCAASNYATTIDASGNLTCAAVPLSDIGVPAADHSITMANKTMTWNFTNPAGGMLWNFTGAATGHSLEIMQSGGNPSTDMHLLHIEAADADPTTLHLVPGSATGKAIKLNTTGENAGPGRFNIDASGSHTWGDGTAATDVTLSRSGAGVLTLAGSLASATISSPTLTGNMTASAATITSPILATPSLSSYADLSEVASPANPSAGARRVFVKSDGKAYIRSSAGVETALGSGNGGVNFITYGDAENNATSGWAIYKDATPGATPSPTATPTGVPTGTVTFATTSGTPLAGSYSYVASFPASNEQGTQLSYDFSVDNASLAKPLQVKFAYNVLSGVYTDNDLDVWIVDRTNGTTIQPAPYHVLNAGTAGTAMGYNWQGEFQTASNSTDYRLILHRTSTAATAFAIRLDSVKVAPTEKVYGAAVTDSAPCTITGSWTGNVTYTAKCSQIGDKLEISGYIALSGQPTPAGGLTVTLPSGRTIDTTKLGAGSGTQTLDGKGFFVDATGSSYPLLIRYSSTTAIRFDQTDDAATGVIDNAQLSDTVPVTGANGDSVNFVVRIPILGWSSSTVMSSDSSTRTIAAMYYKSTPQTIADTATTVITGWTVTSDDTSLCSASTGVCTIQVPGKYKTCAGLISEGTAWTVGSNRYAQVKLTGTKTRVMGHHPLWASITTYMPVGGCSEDNYVAGDTISISVRNGLGASFILDAVAADNWFSVERISGPEQIAASETVKLRYTASTQTFTHAAWNYLDFATKDYDSHGGVSGTGSGPVATINTGWKWVTQSAGLYTIRARQSFGVNNNAIGQVIMSIWKNGVEVSRNSPISTTTTGGSLSLSCGVEDDLQLVAGDRIEIGLYQTNGGSTTLTSNSNGYLNNVSIKRIGL